MCKLGKVVLYAFSMLLVTSQQTAIALDNFDLNRTKLEDMPANTQKLIDESQAMMLDLLTWECSDDNPYKETFDLTCANVSN